MTRIDALKLFMEAGKVDQAQLLQQKICYDKLNKWSISVSWGYSVHIYRRILPPRYLQIQIESFRPWKKSGRLAFVFNTRTRPTDPCEAPAIFFFKSIRKTHRGRIFTNYGRRTTQPVPHCASRSTNSTDMVYEVIVVSQSPGSLKLDRRYRRDCCDVGSTQRSNATRLAIKSHKDGCKWVRHRRDPSLPSPG